MGSNSTGKFPAPYVNSVTEDDPYMKRVDLNHSGIGARASQMKMSVRPDGMAIGHVGGSAGSK